MTTTWLPRNEPDYGSLWPRKRTPTQVELNELLTELELAKDMTAMEVEVWGFKDLETRKKHLVRLAERAAEEAKRKVEEAKELDGAADRLQECYDDAQKLTDKLVKQGKVRIEGNLGSALASRGLASTVGLMSQPTKVICTTGKVRLEEVYWGDPWIAELVQNLKNSGIDANGRQRFYNTIAEMKNDKAAIQAEAGLVALGQYND